MVSTDDPEIADIATSFGATVPFPRSIAAANDHAGLEDVLAEVLSGYEQRGRIFDAVCCILPTAPFVTASMIAVGYSLMDTSSRNGVIPVVRFAYPIQRALKIDPDGLVSMVWPEYENSRSQELNPRFHDAGLFYWLRVSAFRASFQIFLPNCASMELPETTVQDIDTEVDWNMAEMKFRLFKEAGDHS
jgi:N-acylneuraminate cytidylyltransferase